MDLENKKKLHRHFWRGRLDRPLVRTFVPGGPRTGYPGMDFEVPPDQIARKYRILARWHNSLPGDAVATAGVSYGTSFLPALAGAEYRYDGHTSWALPCADTVRELEIPRLRRDAQPWRGFEPKLRTLVRDGVEGAVISMGELVGPMDTLAALVGPQQLCVDIMDCPEAVVEKARDCARLWKQAYDAQWQILGEPDGVAGFNVFLPGRGALWSEDSLALVGPGQFERFYRPAIREVAGALETALLHTHSAAHSCYGALGEIKELEGLEISNDPHGPPVSELAAAGARWQQQGKAVMFSNWNRPIDGAELELYLESCDPSRTFLTLQTDGLPEARRYHEMIRARFG